MPVKLQWLESEDKAQQAEMLKEMIQGQSGVRQMSYQGRDSLWVYGSTDEGRTFLVFIIPHDEITSEAVVAEEYVLNWTRAQLQVTGIILMAMVLIVVVLAFLGSRSVTRPIRELLRVARSIAEGDLEARTNIKTSDELAELGRSFNDMVPKLQDQIKMRQSLSLAMEVQQKLLPSSSPQVPGFDVAGRSIYCDQTGGDYFDFLKLSELGPNLFAVAVGDVTGHGIAAALLMTTARALLRSLANRPGSLAKMMGDINTHLSADAYAGRYMTLFYLVIDTDQRTTHWVSAGHDPALVYDPADGSFDELKGADIPLGIESDWPYQEFSREGWKAGQIIVLGTDGIWETRNPGGEMFGKKRLRELIRDNSRLSAGDIIEVITRALADFRQDRVQTDDVTVVVVKVEE
ncbi:MAG: SpoIIE family protein phosphatase [Deltaproteobacteria bacterium]|nr:SpoIIE family protein phosphatase [Deltaproteobacteria bacterium]